MRALFLIEFVLTYLFVKALLLKTMSVHEVEEVNGFGGQEGEEEVGHAVWLGTEGGGVGGGYLRGVEVLARGFAALCHLFQHGSGVFGGMDHGDSLLVFLQRQLGADGVELRVVRIEARRHKALPYLHQGRFHLRDLVGSGVGREPVAWCGIGETEGGIPCAQGLRGGDQEEEV